MSESWLGPSGKRILLRSTGFGAGVALTLSIFFGAFIWYSSRPKPETPWNSSAIKAVWTALDISKEPRKCLFRFRYSLENATDQDYTIPSTAKLVVRLPGDMGYSDDPDVIWEQGGFIPARQKLNIQVRILFNYADYNFSRANDLKELSKFVDRRLSELDGFALFDSVTRIRIDFPNGWPEAGKRIAEQEKKVDKSK